MKKFTKFVEAWRNANHARKYWFNTKWRLFVVLLLVAVSLVVREYLEAKYLAEFAATAVPVYLVLDKVFYWFLVGVVFGGAAAALMFEGEFAIGIWKSLVHYEKMAERQLGKAMGGKKAKKRKR